MPNPNYDEWLSTTLANHRPEFTDNVFNRRPLAFYLKDKGRVKMKKGGHKIVLPVLLTEANGVSSYSRYDTLSLDTSDTGTAAEFPWKQVQAPVAIDGLTEFINSGEDEVIDLLAAKVKQTEETLAARLNTMWYADGTGNGGKDMMGLAGLVGDASDTVTVVGGIDCATEAKWVSTVNRNAGNFTTAVSGLSVNGINKIRTAVNTVTRGNDSTDLILTTQAVFEAFEAQLNPLTRYEDVASANAGFKNFTYKDIPIMWDEDIASPPSPDGSDLMLYGLNVKHIYLFGAKGRWFYNTPFSTTPDKDAKWSHIILYGNMAIDSRRHQFRIQFDGI